MALDDARLKELADELDSIGGSLPSPRNRQVGKIAAELRGEEFPPTANEVRQAERLQAQADQNAAQAAATEATAAGTPVPPAAGKKTVAEPPAG